MSKYPWKKIEYIINENGCHICISHNLSKAGYPWLKRNGKVRPMSNYIWEDKNGLIPKGIQILHKCDTPACINVEHFFLGTQAENVKDMISKDRQAKGEGNHSKLIKEQVLQIRQELGSQESIARKYNVSQYTISEIKRRTAWSWLKDTNIEKEGDLNG